MVAFWFGSWRTAVRTTLVGLAGFGCAIAAWWIAAETVFAVVGVTPRGGGGTIPNPAEVFEAFIEGGISYYGRHVLVTTTEALIALCWGVSLAFLLALIVIFLPRLEKPIMQIAIVSYCVPIAAIGPIVRIVAGAPSPGEPSGTAIFLGAMLVLFPTLMTSLLGLRAADRSSLDIVWVHGGGRLRQIMKVHAITALPVALNALKIAAPLAFLGAIIGEYFGGVDAGIGPAMVNAQQSLQAPRAWALALLIGAFSGAVYALVEGLSRIVTPWTRGTATGGAPVPPISVTSTVIRASNKERPFAWLAARAALSVVITTTAILLLWWALLEVLRVPPFIGKGPQDVWAYLFNVSVAAENRRYVLDLLVETLLHASVGFSLGLGTALLLASILFVMKPVEQALMRPVLVLQSIPLVALAPLIILIFGRDSLTVAVMGALVVVFPALVTILFGLRSASPYMIELVEVYAGSRGTVFRKVSLPNALPALFAAIRIALPASITAALIAEWLATGDGIGRAIMAAGAQAKMTEVWTLAAVITVASSMLYSVASALEFAVLAQMGIESSNE